MSIAIADYVKAAKLPCQLLPWNGSHNLNARLYKGDAFLFDGSSVAGFHLHREDEHGFWGGYTIMDDSDREIMRHMGAILAAKGRVLKTGLGFGCFVRACLLKPEVEHIDVIEINQSIIDHFGAEFVGNPRVTIHCADAMEFPIGDRQWELAWHDVYTDGNEGLPKLHLELIVKFRHAAKAQGAWQFPHEFSRLAPWKLVGTPRK